ncbi:MAG: NPCBM/NEW2 domain-containing protein [Phycisphaeraceae bacterium]
MRFTFLLAITAFAISPLAAIGDDAQAVFDSLYGSKVKAARLSPDRSDDVAVAQELLQGAALVANQPKLLALICETAYDLGRVDPAGYSTAVQAMRTLAMHMPDRTADALDKIGDLYQKQFGAARGEERNTVGAAIIEVSEEQAALKIKAKDHSEATAILRRALNIARLIKSDRHDPIKDTLDALLERQRLQVRIDKLAAELEAKPGNQATVTELVLLYITELDDPAEANAFLLLSKDETLKKRVLLADDALADVKEDDARDLGEWYRALADQTNTAPAKRKMLTRASLYLKHYLSLHTGSDLNSAKAQLMLNGLSPALDKLGGAVAVSIPSSSGRVASDPGPLPSPVGGESGTLDLNKLKPVAFLTSQETGGLEIIDADTGRFSKGPMQGRQAIIMNDTSLFVKLDDRIAREIPEQSDERWFLRLTALERLNGFVGVMYDGHGGVTFPNNGTGAYTQPPWQRVRENAGWNTIDIELPEPYFLNRQSTGADFKVIIGEQQKPFYIERIELFRVKLPPAAQRTVKPGQTVDLLKIVDLKVDPMAGEWERTATGLRVKRAQFARTGLPIQVRGNYDMQVKFVRTAGNESVNVMLPVGDRHVAFIIDGYARQGPLSGLETLNGKLVPDNLTAVAGNKLTNDKLHTIDIRVRVKAGNASIEADLDGQSLLRWNGTPLLFTGSAWRTQETYRPGLGGFNTDIEFRSATLKLIDGEAKLLVPSRDQAQAAVGAGNVSDASAEAPAGGTTLASLNEQIVSAKAFGKSGKLGSITRIRINNIDLPASLAVFPDRDKPAQIAYTIDGKYKTFLGAVGINDIAKDPYSEVTFRIMGDGKELWRSRPTKERNKVQPFQVNVTGVKKLELIVAAAGDPGFCNCVWAEPTLHEKQVKINLPSSRDNRGKQSFFGIPTE